MARPLVSEDVRPSRGEHVDAIIPNHMVDSTPASHAESSATPRRIPFRERSEFSSPLEVSLRKEGDDYVEDVFGAIAIANTIAYVSEVIDPISIFIGLTRRNLMSQAVRYLLFGEGETGLMVYTILLRYRDWTPEADVRPLIFLMSD